MANKNSRAKQAAKRAVKNNPKAVIIAVIAILLVIAIAFCVLYFGFPKTWESIMSSLRGDNPDGGNNLPPLTLGEGELRVHFIDIGQGDCIYIQFPDGTDMLIDCGQKGSGVKYSKPQEYLTALNPDGIINHLMLTHSDQDHVDYMDEVIYDFEIKNIYMPKILASPNNTELQTKVNALPQEKLSLFSDSKIDKVSTNTYANFFIAALSEENCNIIFNEDPDEKTNAIVIGDETYRLTFYCPTTEFYSKNNISGAKLLNAVSPIGILEYNQKRVVFTGDSNEGNEPKFIERIGYINCDVLKVAHHGSKTSSSAAFLQAVDCEYGIISCGTGNDYDHPTQAALDRMSARNMTVYRTDKNGTVILTIDGNGDMTFTMTTQTTQEENLIGADANATTASLLFNMPAHLWY